jgi:hypothetical protein
MLSEIGSWRRRENGVTFVGSRPREEKANKPFSVVADTNKHYADHHPQNPCWRIIE